MEPEILLGEFDTLLLDNSNGQEGEHRHSHTSSYPSVLLCTHSIFTYQHTVTNPDTHMPHTQ